MILMAYQDYINYVQNNEYIFALFILVAFFIVSKLFVWIAEKVFLRLARKTKTKVDDIIVEKTNRPISLILFLIGLVIAIQTLTIPEIYGFNVEWLIVMILYSCIILNLTYIIIVIIDAIIDEWGRVFAQRTKSDVDDHLIGLFHRFSRIVLFIIAILFILDMWGVKIGPLLASVGIAGIAIAFALQNTLSNIFGGVSLILDKSVKVGDVIRLDTETSGKVIDVGLRSTKIRTWNNEVFVMPNGKLADSKIQNYILPDPSARIVIDFGVEYGADPEKVKKVIMGEIKKIKNVLKDPAPQILFIAMADFSLNFSARFWVGDFKERVSTRELAMNMFYKALNKAKIGIPFPTSTVYMNQIKKRK